MPASERVRSTDGWVPLFEHELVASQATPTNCLRHFRSCAGSVKRASVPNENARQGFKKMPAGDVFRARRTAAEEHDLGTCLLRDLGDNLTGRDQLVYLCK